MAEIRKHDPDADDGLGKLVRDALGERVRPIEPGRAAAVDPSKGRDDDDDAAPSASSMPSWPADGQSWTF